jgi:hypothetical protein
VLIFNLNTISSKRREIYLEIVQKIRSKSKIDADFQVIEILNVTFIHLSTPLQFELNKIKMGACCSRGVLIKLNHDIAKSLENNMDQDLPKGLLKSTRVESDTPVVYSEKQFREYPDSIVSFDVVEDYLKYGDRLFDFWQHLVELKHIESEVTDQSEISPVKT